jgi:hypothetical protein
MIRKKADIEFEPGIDESKRSLIASFVTGKNCVTAQSLASSGRAGLSGILARRRREDAAAAKGGEGHRAATAKSAFRENALTLDDQGARSSEQSRYHLGPTSCSFKIPVLCSSEKRLRFILWSLSWARANFNLD